MSYEDVARTAASIWLATADTLASIRLTENEKIDLIEATDLEINLLRQQCHMVLGVTSDTANKVH